MLVLRDPMASGLRTTLPTCRDDAERRHDHQSMGRPRHPAVRRGGPSPTRARRR